MPKHNAHVGSYKLDRMRLKTQNMSGYREAKRGYLVYGNGWIADIVFDTFLGATGWFVTIRDASSATFTSLSLYSDVTKVLPPRIESL